MENKNLTPEEKLKSVVFFIEATMFEQHTLWEKHKDILDWNGDSEGFMRTIGRIGKKKKNRPVCVMFSFATINGDKRICFYHACSRFVDNNFVKKYLIKNFPITYDNGNRFAGTEAENFHLVIEALKPSVIPTPDAIQDENDIYIIA